MFIAHVPADGIESLAHAFHGVKYDMPVYHRVPDTPLEELVEHLADGFALNGHIDEAIAPEGPSRIGKRKA